jgi:ppGpp synthetase/RelA/SpoT-type nucleotidyltranferase
LSPSNAEIDRVGEAIRAAASEAAIPADVRDAYDEYRQSFAPAVADVMSAVGELATMSAGSRLKTLDATREKLLRQPSARLSQIEDIGGCRIVVRGLTEQDRAVRQIKQRLRVARERDYRERSQHGYRAVHLVVAALGGRDIELQVRTQTQNSWANVSEDLSKRIDKSIKYGGGGAALRAGLNELSHLGAQLDELFALAENRIADNSALLEELEAIGDEDGKTGDVVALGEVLRLRREQLIAGMEATVRLLERYDAMARGMMEPES